MLILNQISIKMPAWSNMFFKEFKKLYELQFMSIQGLIQIFDQDFNLGDAFYQTQLIVITQKNESIFLDQYMEWIGLLILMLLFLIGSLLTQLVFKKYR